MIIMTIVAKCLGYCIFYSGRPPPCKHAYDMCAFICFYLYVYIIIFLFVFFLLPFFYFVSPKCLFILCLACFVHSHLRYNIHIRIAGSCWPFCVAIISAIRTTNILYHCDCGRAAIVPLDNNRAPPRLPFFFLIFQWNNHSQHPHSCTRDIFNSCSKSIGNRECSVAGHRWCLLRSSFEETNRRHSQNHSHTHTRTSALAVYGS